MFSGKMVATRRGTCVGSPVKPANDDAAGIAEPRRTRRRTVIVATRSQAEQTSDSQQDDAEELNTAPAEPASPSKMETRSSKRRPTLKQPDSTNEADVSESESCCSVVSDVQVTPRGRRRTAVRERPTAADKQEASEAESRSSALAKTPRRSTRGQKKTAPVLAESTTSQDDDHFDAESCSSVASLSKVLETRRVTRGRRKSAVPPEDADHSEADSCSSTVPGAQGSTVRRSTRSSRVKVIEPIPIHLEQSETTEASASSGPRRTRKSRGKAKSADEDQAYDSEGCQSGPSLSPRRTTRSEVHGADSDSESISTAYTSLDSPCSLRGRGTPCSSRTGSASSNRAVHVSRTRNISVTLDAHHYAVNMPLVSKSVKKDSNESESKKDQAETTVEMPFQSVSAATSDVEDVEEMEEDANNKTVTSADQECSFSEDAKGDITLTLDEAEVVKPERIQDISSETVKDVQVIEKCQEIADEAMEKHEPESVQEAHAMEEEPSAIPMKPKKGVTVTEEDQSNLVEEPDIEVVQQSSKPAEHEKGVKVLGEPNKKVEAMQEKKDLVADDCAATIDQEPSEKSTMEDISAAQIDEEESSCSSKVPKTSLEKTKPEKEGVSLLDSSEDEESDDELSVEVCNVDAGDLKSEDEMCSAEDQPGPSGAPVSPTGNGLFVIDTRPARQTSEKYYIDTAPHEGDDNVEDEEDFVDEEGDDDDEEDEDSKALFTTRKPALMELSSSIDPGLKVKALGGLYINFDGSKSKSISSNLKKLKEQKNQDELLKKSVIVADFEKKDTVPPSKQSQHAAKLKRKEERAKTSGDGWFNMRAPELTVDLKNDLKALQMRSAIDPKRFYKKNDREGLPKYFQVGTVVDNPIDFYHSRIPKKERKRTIVEELLADAEFRSFNKRKYREIMAEKAAAAAGKMNRNHKFHKKK